MSDRTWGIPFLSDSGSSQCMNTFHHTPVLFAEVLEYLQPRTGGTYIDGTVGGGGHATSILQQIAPNGQLLGIDADPAALAAAQQRIQATIPHMAAMGMFVHGNFTEIGSIARSQGIEAVDGILLDLGVSSYQLDTPARGFSFQQNGPLDMRLDPTQGIPVAEWLETLDEKNLADIIYRYGEERYSRRIARRIVERQRLHPITETRDLAELVVQAVQGGRGHRKSTQSQRQRAHIHPATRTFQALRIAINNELAHLELALPQAVELLRPGGKLVVISFHSLEDRIVKEFFRSESGYSGGKDGLTDIPDTRPVRLRIVTKKPIQASEAEQKANPRSRSAKLRTAQKV